MKERYRLRGLVVSLNTPFTEDDRVDFPSLARAVEMHLREGAVGFLVPAQAAEVMDLRLGERIDLVRAVRETTRGRAVVFAGATAADPEESLALAAAAVKAGCDGVLSEPAPGMARTFGSLHEYFRRFEAELLMIQDLDWAGPGIPVPVIGELFERLEAFRCLKVEVNPAGPKYTAVLKETGGRLHVSGGWAALQMIEALDRGVDVFMNTAFTRFYQGVMEAHAAGDRPLAAARFQTLLPVLAFTRQHLDISIQFHKLHFRHLGVFETARCRKRVLPWDDYYERVSRELIDYIQRVAMP